MQNNLSTMTALTTNRPRPVQSPRPVYAGPATPTDYDPNWPRYKLSEAQITAFQNMPQSLIDYSQDLCWQAETKLLSDCKRPYPAHGTVVAIPATADLPAIATAQTKIQAHRALFTSHVAAIQAVPPTITTRAQIDTAFIAIL